LSNATLERPQHVAHGRQGENIAQLCFRVCTIYPRNNSKQITSNVAEVGLILTEASSIPNPVENMGIASGRVRSIVYSYNSESRRAMWCSYDTINTL